MDSVEVLVLALVQGVTEFLPISSSGHLTLTAWLFGWDEPSVAFDAAVHVGTLLAVLLVFAREWLSLALGVWRDGAAPHDRVGPFAGASGSPVLPPPRRFVLLLIVATVPLAIVGILIRDHLDSTFANPTGVGAFLLVTAVGLLVAEAVGRRTRTVAGLAMRDAAMIGVAQAIAVVPGLSRSGLTMMAGMGRDLTREEAARFALFLAGPAILGAGLVAFADWLDADGGDAASDLLIGAGVSFLTAVVAIRLLLRLLQTHTFRPFIGYCAMAGLAVLIARAAGA